MIRGFAVLLLCQLLGESSARWLGLSVPGPVIGMALLFVGLLAWGRIRRLDNAALTHGDVGRASDGLLSILSMLFVPAGVGVVQYLHLIGANGVAIGAALVLSTALTLAVTVGIFVLVKQLMGPAPQEPQEPHR